MEKTGLACLPPDLRLPSLEMLSIDWAVLAASHAVLPHAAPRLQTLILGAIAAEDAEQAALAPAAAAPQPADVAASLTACPALCAVNVLVYQKSHRACVAGEAGGHGGGWLVVG